MNTYEEKQARRREYYEAKMDDEIREEVHREMAPCSEQEFMDEYVKRHEAKYGETFEIN